MLDQLGEQVRRIIDRKHQPVLGGLGERGHALGQEIGQHVRLLKLGVGLVEDDRHPLRELMVHLPREHLVGRLRKRHHLVEVLLLLRVVVDVEVRRRVLPEVERLVLDLVLAELGRIGRVDELRLHRRGPGEQHRERREQRERQAAATEAGATVRVPEALPDGGRGHGSRPPQGSQKIK